MFYRAMSLLVIVMTFAGCGFQLRGAGLAQGMTYQLVTEQEQSAGYADFQRVLKATLERAGVREAAPADVTLRISSFQAETRDGAVNAELRVAENISTASLELSVLDGKGNLLADELLLQQRTAYRMDRSQLLGSYQQQTSVEQDVRQALANQILRALSVLTRSMTGLASADSESDVKSNAP